MWTRLRERALVAGAVCFPLLLLGCRDDPMHADGISPCSPTAGSVFLNSNDDDDGDGDPRDENFPTINDEDDDIADHAWIEDAHGAHHLFFQNEDWGAGSDIVHYVTTDLQALTYVGVALQKNPGGWDSRALWAPHIVRHGHTYFMFYTGTSGTGTSMKQRLGLATSTDLVTWTRTPVNLCPGTSGDGCIYECAESWTTWGQPGAHNQQCRDPFVLWDGEHRRWVLFATARSTNGYGVVTVATSSDLMHWAGAGYIDATRLLIGGSGSQPVGGQAENPYVLFRGGTYTLLFTDWADPEDDCTVPNPRTIVQTVTSPTLLADAGGSHHWTYRGFIPDPGVNAIEALVVGGDTWIFSQSIADRTSCDYTEHRRELRLKRIVWGPEATFTTSPWAPCANAPQ